MVEDLPASIAAELYHVMEEFGADLALLGKSTTTVD